MEYLFIDKNHDYYQRAIDLRISLFFKNMDNPNSLIDDKYEINSQHLICIDGKNLAGTGRLSVERKQGIISQMAIKKDYQGKGIGSEILLRLLAECSGLGLDEIKLSARKTAIDFYRKFGFEVYGVSYESKKTGVIHQNMKKQLH